MNVLRAVHSLLGFVAKTHLIIVDIVGLVLPVNHPASYLSKFSLSEVEPAKEKGAYAALFLAQTLKNT